MTTAQTITASQGKDIKTAFATLKPQKVTLDGNRTMTVKEAIFALAPTLERMKKRGLDMPELVEKLHEKGISVKAPTLAKYLNEFRRGKGRKRETHPRRPCNLKRLRSCRNRADHPRLTEEDSPPRRTCPGGFVAQNVAQPFRYVSGLGTIWKPLSYVADTGRQR